MEAAGRSAGRAKGSAEVVETTPLQQAHARRVAESKATIPHTYLETEVRANAYALGVGEIVRATALALGEHPRLNGAYRDGNFELYERVNVGVAVAAQGTTLFPVLHDAAGKDGGELEAELARLSERARDGSLTQPEQAGATFSLADLRELGMTSSQGVIRGGQAGFLSVGAANERLILSLACDARILQGEEAATFLANLRGRLDSTAKG